MSNTENNSSSGLRRPELWAIPQHSITATALDAKAEVLYERLKTIAAEHQDVRFATSLAAEDMVCLLYTSPSPRDS